MKGSSALSVEKGSQITLQAFAQPGNPAQHSSYPPYVIWIQRGNCSTREIEGLLRQRFSAIQTWARQASPGLMVVL